ncbi:zonular occludens toxin domain-containing protein [Xanthomonas sp. XNM01]|uniref:zonular occludens toxin domain-containing protein n=1 Tax=Xanthomonas sp. XNM01 TaxID=2769289 RepID=UPI00177B1525|nr:zonular occludens toxin domain-containing protein [Xanthomonas sp. XNM01]MBD9368374.1 Zona occludens toxin [Xanthomonas sp. XNM01]
MLILLEGPPRAGKSYSALKDHILPALRAGRTVYARLNGLDHEKIAAHLQLPQDRVRELLVVVKQEEVVALLTVFGDDPPRFQVKPDSLIVIDEVQDYYASSRQPLPKEQGAFFAKHGHIGLDVVIMSQAVGAIHSSIRQRVERKNVYAKLNALGKADRYVVRFYSVGDTMGKFEKIGSETHDYDPHIFPLYHGFQPGVENTDAYTEGSRTVWQVIKWPAIGVSIATLVGVFFLVRFFFVSPIKEGHDVIESQKASAPAMPAKDVSAVSSGSSPIAQAAAPSRKKLSPGVRYIVDLTLTARPRYLGEYQAADHMRYLVEFRATQGATLERLDSIQLQGLGFHVERTDYGLVAEAEGETIVFTPWPIDLMFTQSSAQTARISAASGGSPAAAQPTQPTAGAGASTAQAVLISSGGLNVDTALMDDGGGAASLLN